MARKYLRVCGEEPCSASLRLLDTEIPPRVRRRVPVFSELRIRRGNTSACAEKRIAAPGFEVRQRKYLRVCGEEFWFIRKAPFELEIPPRVRRRVKAEANNVEIEGNTSACAEKSASAASRSTSCRKYLRVCGEEQNQLTDVQLRMEIPPRVRRRGFPQGRVSTSHGNTSACAEKSLVLRV